jgi:ankyrin repeat protein
MIEMLLHHHPEQYQHLQLNLQLNSDQNAYQERGGIPFHEACRFGRYRAVGILLNYVDLFDINAVDEDGNTSLHLVCRYHRHFYNPMDDKILLLQRLLQHNIRINQKNVQGNTAYEEIKISFKETEKLEQH